MARYCNLEAVKTRLENKVRFACAGDKDPNLMSVSLFNSLINEAETQIEIDLMIRYELPFQEHCAGTFAALPVTTKTFLTTLAELLACVRVLETDFGRGTSANGEKYTEKMQKRYETMVKQLVELKESDKKSYQTWLRPPLEGLKLAYSNQGDTGFRGRAHNTTTIRHQADYAAKQINSPGENYFFGNLDPLDLGPHN